MDQRNDRKPNPAAKPEQPRGNTSPATGGKSEPASTNHPTGGAFGKEGHSNRRGGVDSTGAHIAGDERSGLDEDTPHTAVGDPHLTRARKE
jgi:hypothetical protein